jgi:D-sedoheptulose 7-phosphate isomerase
LSEELKKQIYDSMADREKMIRAGKNSYPDAIIPIAKVLQECISQGGKILLCGNGGSAADCQHFAAEMIVRLTSRVERIPLPAIALTTDSSILTAAGNDYGFDMVFARQVQGLGRKGDALITISTSGNSENIVKALDAAALKGMTRIGILGDKGGRCLEQCDYSIVVPGDSTMRIQEEHTFLLHTIAQITEKLLLEEA